MGNQTKMSQQRDLNRTREQIMAAAQKEFAEHGFAGARTDAIARRARVNERMIFYCFESKEGLYRAVLKQKLSEKAALIEPDEDFTTGLIKGFATICNDRGSSLPSAKTATRPSATRQSGRRRPGSALRHMRQPAVAGIKERNSQSQ